MTTALERRSETALASTIEASSELAPTQAAAAVTAEIQAAILIAKKMPRDEDQAFSKLMRSCARGTFAEAASYSFPRGGSTVSGPSVDLAREAARIWGNVRYGLEVVRDDEATRQIRGWAWDLETNTKIVAEDDFRKLVQRKQRNGETAWVTPDERDLRELTNRRGAILVRNCILQLLPKDLIEDARSEAAKTLQKDAKADPDAAKKRIIASFSELSVSPEMLAAYLGHPLAESSPAEIAKLREIYASIRDGNSTWREYIQPTMAEVKPKAKGKEALDALASSGYVPDVEALEIAAVKALGPTGPKQIASIAKAEYGVTDLSKLTESQMDKLDAYLAEQGARA